jgi:hypothetical protein
MVVWGFRDLKLSGRNKDKKEAQSPGWQFISSFTLFFSWLPSPAA